MNLKKQFTAAILSAMAFAVLSAGDLPGELQDVAKDKIIDFSKFIYGPQKADDPESPTGKAAVYVPAKDAKNHGGIGMGIYTRSKKQVVGFVRPKADNEKYNWYKIPRREKDIEFPGGRNNTQVYLENWQIGAWVPEDVKGKFDCWILVKVQGPFYVAGSDKENKLFLARVLLVPLE